MNLSVQMPHFASFYGISNTNSVPKKTGIRLTPNILLQYLANKVYANCIVVDMENKYKLSPLEVEYLVSKIKSSNCNACAITFKPKELEDKYGLSQTHNIIMDIENLEYVDLPSNLSQRYCTKVFNTEDRFYNDIAIRLKQGIMLPMSEIRVHPFNKENI